VREKIRITAIGSCRISTPFKAADQFFPIENNNSRIYGYTHSSKEALQQIAFLQGNFRPPTAIYPLLLPNANLDKLAIQKHAPSDIYVVELSSAKQLHIDDVAVQLNYVTRHFGTYFADKTRASRFWQLSDGNCRDEKNAFLESDTAFTALTETDQILLRKLTLSMATEDSLAADIVEMQALLPRLVILTHCNVKTSAKTILESRARYIDMVQRAAKRANAAVFNPTISMQAFGQSAALADPDGSLSHYSPDFADFLFAGIFDRHMSPLLSRGAMAPSQAVETAILTFTNRAEIKSIAPRIGGVTFITGSLGAGGAERQLTRIASGMRNSNVVSGDIEVIVSTLCPERGRDFFLPDLHAANIKTKEIPTLPASLDPCELDTGLRDILRFLPPQTTQALNRLAPHLMQTRPDVVYIWQDGAVLATALAALVANVPRIVISLRGMPPNLRPEMMKDEYFSLYRALSHVPGVTFSTNSHVSADAYADWLGLAPKSVRVIHNAAETLPVQSDEHDRKLWEGFAQTTAGADFTFGGVFRFDANKRPLLWLECAAAGLAAHPNSRFVLVGDGALMQAARTRASDLGIAERCLFVGKTRNVGFWMARMNALALLSRLEGLPNVLIEAQLAGLPVISTPAGGAGETFSHGQTGYLLKSTEAPALSDFLSAYLSLVQDPAKRKAMGRAAKHYAEHHFATKTIQAETLALLSGTSLPRHLELEAARA